MSGPNTASHVRSQDLEKNEQPSPASSLTSVTDAGDASSQGSSSSSAPSSHSTEIMQGGTRYVVSGTEGAYGGVPGLV
eukprot:2569160-Rhodomonas_salina.1